MDTSQTDQSRSIVDILNEVSPDTFDEGEFGAWTFTGVSRDANAWRVAFRNREAADGDAVRFEFAGDAVDTHGTLHQEWADALSSAVFRWETQMRGDDVC